MKKGIILLLVLLLGLVSSCKKDDNNDNGGNNENPPTTDVTPAELKEQASSSFESDDYLYEFSINNNSYILAENSQYTLILVGSSTLEGYLLSKADNVIYSLDTTDKTRSGLEISQSDFDAIQLRSLRTILDLYDNFDFSLYNKEQLTYLNRSCTKYYYSIPGYDMSDEMIFDNQTGLLLAKELKVGGEESVKITTIQFTFDKKSINSFIDIYLEYEISNVQHVTKSWPECELTNGVPEFSAGDYVNDVAYDDEDVYIIKNNFTIVNVKDYLDVLKSSGFSVEDVFHEENLYQYKATNDQLVIDISVVLADTASSSNLSIHIYKNVEE